MKEYTIGTTPPREDQRKKWQVMDDAKRESIIDRVVELYDGTRTLSRCWKMAFSEDELIGELLEG